MPAGYNAAVRRHFIVLLLVAILSVAWPRPVGACSCVPPDPPPQAFSAAHAVFSGTVSQVNTGGNRLGQLFEPLRQLLGLAQPAGLYSQVAVVQVTQSWKGVQSSPVKVQTDGGAMCGFPFVAGQQYVIYAYSGGGPLSASSCSRTAELSQAVADLSYLQSQPTLAVQTAVMPGWAGWLAFGAAAVFGLALLTSAVWLVRRRAHKKEAT